MSPLTSTVGLFGLVAWCCRWRRANIRINLMNAKDSSEAVSLFRGLLLQITVVVLVVSGDQDDGDETVVVGIEDLSG